MLLNLNKLLFWRKPKAGNEDKNAAEPNNEHKIGYAPIAGGSRSSTVSINNSLFGNKKQEVSPEFSLEWITILRRLSVFDSNVSRAVTNTTSLANTSYIIELPDNLSKRDRKKIMESIVKIKIDKKLCFLQARYFPSKDSQINDLVSLPKNKGKKLVGFLLTMKSIDFVETEDKMSIELQNGFIIHSAYKIFIHNEFGEEIPAVSYMYFFDADKYRMAKNNCELQHQTIQ